MLKILELEYLNVFLKSENDNIRNFEKMILQEIQFTMCYVIIKK